MKKLTVLSVLLAVMVIVAWSTAALAGSAYSNAKADFTATLSAPAGASGHAIINYDKGEASLVVQVNVRNLMPNTQYRMEIDGWGVLKFMTDGKGKGQKHKVLTTVPATYTKVEILVHTTSVVHLEASEAAGTLTFRGGKRGA